MERSCWNRHELARTNNDPPVSELDDQLSIHAEKGLVGFRMSMPRKLLRHDTHSNFMVVDGTERHIFISFADGLAERERVNDCRHAILIFGHMKRAIGDCAPEPINLHSNPIRKVD